MSKDIENMSVREYNEMLKKNRVLNEEEIRIEDEKRKAQELQKEKARIDSMPKSEQARKNAEENRKNANFRKLNPKEN